MSKRYVSATLLLLLVGSHYNTSSMPFEREDAQEYLEEVAAKVTDWYKKYFGPKEGARPDREHGALSPQHTMSGIGWVPEEAQEKKAPEISFDEKEEFVMVHTDSDSEKSDFDSDSEKSDFEMIYAPSDTEDFVADYPRNIL